MSWIGLGDSAGLELRPYLSVTILAEADAVCAEVCVTRVRQLHTLAFNLQSTSRFSRG